MLTACGSTREKFTYGGYVESHEQQMIVYHQYELSYVIDVKGKKVTRTEPFAMNRIFALPTTTTELAMGLYVKNIKEEYYEVWEIYEVLYDGTNEPYHIKRRLQRLELPDKVLRISLPKQNGAFYNYRIELLDSVGSVLFSMGNAKYKVAGE